METRVIFLLINTFNDLFKRPVYYKNKLLERKYWIHPSIATLDFIRERNIARYYSLGNIFYFAPLR